VVVPSYRRPDSLTACLNGLACQTRTPDEIVPVIRDDDVVSQEHLRDWIAAHPKAEHYVKPVIVRRPGQIPAMNAGLSAATGDIICFLDDDCIPRPKWLEFLLAHYSDQRVAGVGGRDVVHYANGTVEGDVSVVGKYQWFGRPVGNHHLNYVPGRPAHVDILKGANMSFRRELLPPFDEALQLGAAQCNDLDASLALRRRGYTLIYDPNVVVDHYPAQRHGAATREYDAPHMLFAEGHNWMYVVLKHALPWQVPVVVAYGFLVGHARAYGLARAAAGALTIGPVTAAHRLWHSLRGKVAGIKTWLRRAARKHEPASA
jgi:GT2 family glycosyltransferase